MFPITVILVHADLCNVILYDHVVDLHNRSYVNIKTEDLEDKTYERKSYERDIASCIMVPIIIKLIKVLLLNSSIGTDA